MGIDAVLVPAALVETVRQMINPAPVVQVAEAPPVASLVTIPALASSLPQFSTLVSLLTAADLVGAVSGGSLTVFAPTNDAFAKLPEALVSFLTKPENKQTLAKVLKYHVLGQKVLSKDVKSGTIETLDTGSMLYVTADSSGVSLRDGGVNTARVTQA